MATLQNNKTKTKTKTKHMQLVKTYIASLSNGGLRRINNNFRFAFLALVLSLLSTVARATDTAPLDLSATATSIAGYITTAAASAVVIFAAFWGIRMIIKAVKTVGK